MSRIFFFFLQNLSSSILLENSVIKGYHDFKIRPPVTDPPTKLFVDREYTNIHDHNACLVWVPTIEKFECSLHSITTDEKRGLFLKDVAGLPLGHVPRGLAGSFRDILDGGGEITAIVTGPPMPSFPPWPNPNDIGGGVVLPCHYTITHSNRVYAFNAIRNALLQMPEAEVMTLV